METIKTAFGDWRIGPNGSAIDMTHGLMWMRGPARDQNSTDIFKGDWYTATSTFGRGNNAYATNAGQLKLGQIVKESIQYSGVSNGYARGSERYSHAGFDDWRLPTLDEVIHLTFDEAWGAKKIQAGLSSPKELWKLLLDPTCSTSRGFWAANKCREKPITVRSLLGFRSPYSTFAWAFWLSGDQVAVMDVGGVDEIEPTFSALLVRASKQ